MSDLCLERFFDLNGTEYKKQEPMSSHTTFKIGGAADFYIEPRNKEELRQTVRELANRNMPCFVIGNGSNLLVSDDGIRGAVISTSAMHAVRLTEENTVFAEAGAPLTAVCLFAAKHALSGLEFAYGIPGSVGGALYMNAGAYGGQMADVVACAESLDRDFCFRMRGISELGLGYRKSIYAENREIVTGVTFRLKKGDEKDIFDRMNELMEKRKARQPLEYPSAGSTFKRPEGFYAAALIDECGLKGVRIGDAQVSEKHAGFVINRGDATCGDVLRLIAHIQETVLAQKGVSLETEVVYFGR